MCDVMLLDAGPYIADLEASMAANKERSRQADLRNQFLYELVCLPLPKPTCPNCGAPKHGAVCEYCKT